MPLFDLSTEKRRYSPLGSQSRSALALSVTIVFGVFFCFCVFYSSFSLSRDPSSFFFRPSTAYNLEYSALRRQQARDFIATASNELQTKADKLRTPEICIGVPTVARNGSLYFPDAVGSLFEGLHYMERDKLHVMLFFAHSDPEDHPAYQEPWVENVADTVLTYHVDLNTVDKLREMEEQETPSLEKAVYDYAYLLENCHGTGARHVLIVEDDVLAMDNWLQRTYAALTKVNSQTKSLGFNKWLFLRLFFTEEFFSWSRGHKSALFYYCLLVYTLELVVFAGLNHFLSGSSLPGRLFSRQMCMLYTLVFTPLLIVYALALGRLSWAPLPQGVIDMNSFGCCSQSLLFPNDRVPAVVDYLREKKVGTINDLLEEYASKYSEVRWTLNPSVMQHIGAGRSEAEMPQDFMKHGRPVTASAFNFQFETNDKRILMKEHAAMLEKQGIW